MAHRPRPARLGHRLVLSLLLFMAVPLTWQQSSVAVAAPADASLTDVFSALHLSPEPADYIVIVDTSASMADKENRYQRVQAGLSRMAQALSPDDRVAVITFDATPVVRRPLIPIGSNRGAVVASLPSAPKGQATDIGRGISAAIDLMQSSNLRSRAAVLLFTDGQIDTDKSSPYATVTSPGWAALKQRASALQSSHDIAPLAIALAANTDAAVLKQVFTNVTDVQASDLGSYLSQVSTEVMKAAAITRLKDHMADPVTASLDGLDAASASGTTSAKLVLHNTNPQVPVEINGLAVAAQPASAVVVKGIPSSVSISPGETSTIPVTVTMTPPPAGSSSTYQITGDVSTPWRKVLDSDLQLKWAAKLTSAPQRITSQAPSSPVATTRPATTTKTGGWPILPIVGGLALLAVLILALRALRGASGPQLTGTVSVLRLGRPVDERLLRGRTMSFTLTDPPVALTLRGTKGRDARPGVIVSASAGKERVSRTLFEGDTLDFAGLVVTYTTDRTRMLRLIGTD